MKRMNEEKLSEMEAFIHRYIEENNGQSPKFREILKHMGMNNSVGYRYLTTLRDRGVIRYSGRDSLSVDGQEQMKMSTRRIAIYGMIPCGPAEDFRQETLGYATLPAEWADSDCYLLRTTGDSMVDIGIGDGDLVLIRRTCEATDGQVVAVLTEDGTTLKRLMKKGSGRPWLLAENKTYPQSRRELHPDEIKIQGLALKVIKNIE